MGHDQAMANDPIPATPEPAFVIPESAPAKPEPAPVKPRSAGKDTKTTEKARPRQTGTNHEDNGTPSPSGHAPWQGWGTDGAGTRGEFTMGSEHGDADEQPVHRVFLDSFYLDAFEVANGRFAKFVGRFRVNSRGALRTKRRQSSMRTSRCAG